MNYFEKQELDEKMKKEENNRFIGKFTDDKGVIDFKKLRKDVLLERKF